jgi:hypothetical protein
MIFLFEKKPRTPKFIKSKKSSSGARESGTLFGVMPMRPPGAVFKVKSEKVKSEEFFIKNSRLIARNSSLFTHHS